MTGYLLDTNVISAFAPDRPAVPPTLSGWLEARSNQLFLSVVSIVEIEAGIRRLHRIGSTVRAKALGTWIDRLQENYSERILAFDLVAGRIAGAITDRTRAGGANPARFRTGSDLGRSRQQRRGTADARVVFSKGQ